MPNEEQHSARDTDCSAGYALLSTVEWRGSKARQKIFDQRSLEGLSTLHPKRNHFVRDRSLEEEAQASVTD